MGHEQWPPNLSEISALVQTLRQGSNNTSVYLLSSLTPFRGVDASVP